MRNILIVEDSPEFAERCVGVLVAERFEVFLTDTPDAARLILLKQAIDVALIDMMLPPTLTREGVELLRFIRTKYPNIRTVMMTQRETGTTEAVAEAMRAGAHTFLDKNSAQFEQKLRLSLEEIMAESKNRVFVSFGHNELLKLKLKVFLKERLNLEPVMLADLPGRGLTIVEQLERVSATCARAVILLTRDDAQEGTRARARQNVIHEVGFFQGKYGRENVVLLAEEGIELFSNITGIKIIEFETEHFEAIYEPLRAELLG